MKTAVITGVSKGLGKALASEFRENGFFIVGISRNRPDCVVDHHITADLTKHTDLKKVVSEIKKHYEKIDVLINNAGIGLYESWEEMKEEDLRKLFELNFFSPVILTKDLLPLIKKAKGTIINVSSVAGKLYVPFMGAYCSSKFALNAFSDSLRAELLEDNVHMLNLIVGRINTGFSSRAMGNKKPPKTPFSSSPEKFAEAAFKAYKKKKREIVFPSWYRYFVLLARLFPSVYDRSAVKKWENQGE